MTTPQPAADDDGVFVPTPWDRTGRQSREPQTTAPWDSTYTGSNTAEGRSNFNPNIKIDTSTTTSTGTNYTAVDPGLQAFGAMADDGLKHYAAGHSLGTQIGQRINQHLDEQFATEFLNELGGLFE